MILACALVAGCGSDDDSGSNGDSGDTGTAETVATERFESPRIGFTFDYPGDLVAQRRPRRDVLAQVSIERGSAINAVKVRRTSNRELDRDSYLDEFERDFERTVGAVEQREEEIGGLDVGVLEFEDSVELRGEPVDFTSTSYFFTGGGRTWQVECIAEDAQRDRIERACTTVLESIEF
jgi:hypothetical protein